MDHDKLKINVTFNLQLVHLLALVANLELALRHPGNQNSTSDLARKIGYIFLRTLDSYEVGLSDEIRKRYYDIFEGPERRNDDSIRGAMENVIDISTRKPRQNG